MKTLIDVSTDKISGLEWPENCPLPSNGDTVLMRHDNSSIGFTVTSRHFQHGVDPSSGEDLTIITINGKQV